MRIYTSPTNLEVTGTTMLSFVENIGSDQFADLIAKHNLSQIDTSRWYPVQPVFDLFNDIAKKSGGIGQVFVAMGMKIAEQSDFPPEMKQTLTLVGILEGWQEHYAVNHRGADFPPVETIKVTGKHYQLVLQHNHIYPFDLVYGMAYGFCRLLLPKGTKFVVKYDDEHSPYADYSDKVIVNIKWD